MAKKDYYDVLGVAKSAAADEIKKAHRRLVRQYHPDRNAGDKAAEEKFKEVQEAYDVLSDPDKRVKYDQFGHAGVGNAGAGGDPFDAFRRAGGAGNGRRQQWRPSQGVSVEDFDMNDLGGGGNFGDIFEQLFGGARAGGATGRAGRGRPPQPPQRGSDVEYPVTLTFEQAARGVTLPLQITGDTATASIDVKIPAGVKDGSRVRIKGRGQPSAGGQPGDLFIIAHVEPHAFFRRDDLDILLDLPLSVYEALLGAKVEVPTLDGPRVTLTIPPGTSSGAKLRIRGRGIERASEKGDQLVVVKIVLPKTLDESDKDAVRQIEQRNPVDARADVIWK